MPCAMRSRSARREFLNKFMHMPTEYQIFKSMYFLLISLLHKGIILSITGENNIIPLYMPIGLIVLG
jgi:hypothetical protein